MEISRRDIDTLNAIVNVKVNRADYAEKIDETLKDYRKKANIPGFRKGRVPMGMIKKQYQTSVTVNEINKLLQDSLEKYLKEEKIDVLGSPLPKAQEDLNWEADVLDFDFELGLAPDFEVNLDILKKIKHFVIEPDVEMVNEELTRVRKLYGKLTPQKHIDENCVIAAQCSHEVSGLDALINIEVNDIRGKEQLDTLKKVAIGETVPISIKGLFEDDYKVKQYFKLDDEKFEEFTGYVLMEIREVNKRILAELNQELFDKLYQPGTVIDEGELKQKIKEDLKQQLVSQSDQKLMNDISNCFVENIKFELPDSFLKRWIQNSGEKTLTEDEASDEYAKSEKGIRRQLIESKLIKAHKLDYNFEELQAYAKNQIQIQLAQYGQSDVSNEELNGIVSKVFTNKEEVRRLSNDLINEKLLNFFKEAAPLKVEKVNFEAFVKEAYAKSS